MIESARERALAWLQTVGADTAATLMRAPDATIIPETQTDGGRALELLRQVAQRDAGGAVELRMGKTIGEGGMGVVRAAEQVSLARPVAVKTLRRAEGAIDLLREAWITGSLEHPNVVPVHHLGVDENGLPLIVLKRIAGVEWNALARASGEVERRFGTADLLAWNLGILLQVLNAVRFAHSRGIVHRDLKPANVMIGDFGEVYLLDWGIAVSLIDDGSGRLPLARNATELAGTPAYLAPEMLAIDDTPITEQTDVYLAGAVLYELIAGHPPHRGTDAASVVAQVIAGEPELPPDVPEELAALCRRAMMRVPGDRFPTADAMHAALTKYLEHRVSAQIAERAVTRLDELARVLAAPSDDRREAVYRELAACRAGFQEALAVWRDNGQAQRGLARATVAVAEHELASGDPRAALRLLGELEAPPAELLARAKAAAAAVGARQQQLEALGADRDPSVGQRTRWVLLSGFGALFTAAPLIGQYRPDIMLKSNAHLAMFSAAAATLIALAIIWARESIQRTAYNRQAMLTMMSVFVVQVVLAIGAELHGYRVEDTQMTLPLLWMAVALAATITIDHGFAIAAVGYAATYLASSADPRHFLFYQSGGNAIFMLTAVWRWRPDPISGRRRRASSRDASR